MMLGTDVSDLSTTAANAAAQGLSIVVPLYNEAAGLPFLHQRLGGALVIVAIACDVNALLVAGNIGSGQGALKPVK